MNARSPRKPRKAKPQPLQIEMHRLTFISVETLPQLLTGSQSNPFLKSLTEGSFYKRLFDEARAGKAPFGLKPPWPREDGQRFWFHYLNDTFKGNEAWNSFVPLRRVLNDPITTPLPEKSYLMSEAFYYPFGTAFVLNFFVRGIGGLSDAVDQSYRLRFEAVYTMASDAAAKPMTYDSLSERVFKQLRTEHLGPQADPGIREDKPFSIFTVVKTASCPEQVVKAKSDLHQGLAAVADWPQYWTQTPPGDLAKATLQISPSPPGHLLYGGKHGRTVWFPMRFQTAVQKPTLRCYHRNLVFASLQTESLAGVVRYAVAELDKSGSLALTLKEMSQAAANLLTRLYLANQRIKTYRTASVKARIDQDGLKADINKIRNYLGSSSIP